MRADLLLLLSGAFMALIGVLQIVVVASGGHLEPHPGTDGFLFLSAGLVILTCALGDR